MGKHWTIDSVDLIAMPDVQEQEAGTFIINRGSLRQMSANIWHFRPQQWAACKQRWVYLFALERSVVVPLLALEAQTDFLFCSTGSKTGSHRACECTADHFYGCSLFCCKKNQTDDVEQSSLRCDVGGDVVSLVGSLLLFYRVRVLGC